jgi:[protein-PII] uridylyltransferase
MAGASWRPFSDLDLLLVHQGKGVVAPLASALWYPIWDAGLKLGHGVRDVAQSRKLASTDLDVATSLLTARHLAGDERLARDVIDQVRSEWRKRGERRLAELRRRNEERHGSASATWDSCSNPT